MYKKILFGTCMTEYCDHIFNFALNLAKENEAKLLIFHGLGKLNLPVEKVEEAVKKTEARIGELYVERMRNKDFSNYAINVSDGDVVSEMSKMARNAAVDLIVLGTSTNTPIARGERIEVGPLGATTAKAILWAPCQVLIVPPALIPGLARG